MASKIKVDQLETADGTGTIALQNQLSGLTSASMPTGSVIQVVHTQYTNTTAWSSTSLAAHGATAVITPASTNSKIYIIAQVHHQAEATNGADAGMGFAWKRGSTTIWETAQSYSSYFYGGGGSNMHENRGYTTFSYLDSPNTTSATTYALWAKKHSGSATHYFQGSGHPTMITLMEIA